MTIPLRRSLVALSVLAVGTLGACADDDAPAEFDNPGQDVTRDVDDDAPSPAASTPPAGPASADSGTGATVAHPDAADAVASHTYDLERPTGASATVAVHPLRVDGQVMVLQLSFTPDFSGDERLTVFDMNQGRSFRPVLNDRENLKQYSVVTDDMGTSLETDWSGLGPRVRSGETLTYWAYYAAPEDDIDSIVVSLDFVEFPDVPIERP